MTFFRAFSYLEPKTGRNLLILFASALSFWISITVLLPTLPAYIADIGGTKQDVGLVMGAFAIGLLGSRTWLGKLADRRSRKLVLTVGTVIAAVTPLGYLFIQTIPLLMLIRAVHGISMAAFTIGYSVLVVDLSPLKQRGELIGYMSLAVPVGMAIGPALGSFLQDWGGYQALFFCSCLAGTLALLLAQLVREDRACLEGLTKDNDIFQPPVRSFGQILSNPSLLVPTLVLFLVGLLFGGLITFLPLYIREYQLGISAGLFYTLAAIASFIGRVVSGKASDRYGRGIFVTVSLVCYGLSMLVLGLSQSEGAMIFGALLEGTGGGILIPLLIALISDRSSAMERGKVYAICLGGFDVGMAIAGPILGFLNIGYATMFLGASGLGAIALGLFFSASNPTVGSSWKFALGLARDRYALK